MRSGKRFSSDCLSSICVRSRRLCSLARLYRANSGSGVLELDLSLAGCGGRGNRQSRASKNSCVLCVVATLVLRSIEPERRRSMDFDLGCTGGGRSARVKQLFMLKRDASMEELRDGTGLRGMEKEEEGRRRSIGSDLDLTSACVGRLRPASSSTSSSSSQNIGSSGNSLPGR